MRRVMKDDESKMTQRVNEREMKRERVCVCE